ncbi:MAG: circadian clock protein KaiC [Desulfococcaceae bacterium]
MERENRGTESPRLGKCPTGISGFDEITEGGLPRGRPTLVCGGAGSGKTLFAMEFLVTGATGFEEPGVFISFEENETELTENVASLGWDVSALAEQEKMFLDFIYIERREIEETGEFNLDGLFIRVEYAVRTVNARRIVIDGIEALFSGFSDESLLRSEIRRLFRRLKELGLTAIVTAERGERTLTRRGLEEYISDCVVFLDHRMEDQVATRRLRVVKYRGAAHETNEFPFLIGDRGFSVFPVTSLEMDYPVSAERISSGIPRLDSMLGGKGFYRGSSVLISGTAGTGKSSLAAAFAAAACRRGERTLYLSFEEAPRQIIRNMAGIGIDLDTPLKEGAMRFHAARATSFGLELHLSIILKRVEDFGPDVLLIDPISNLTGVASAAEVKRMLTRLIDSMKSRGITTLFSDLIRSADFAEDTETAISSLMDSWLLLRHIETNGERNRGIQVLKSRGMSHSNQIRELVIDEKGLSLKDVYVGPAGVLTGTARLVQEAEDSAEARNRARKIARLRRELQRKERVLESQISALRNAFACEKEDIEEAIAAGEAREAEFARHREHLAHMRGRD